MRGYLFLRITAWLLALPSGLALLLWYCYLWLNLTDPWPDFSAIVVRKWSVAAIATLAFLSAIAGRLKRLRPAIMPGLPAGLAILAALLELLRPSLYYGLPAELMLLTLRMVFIGSLWLDLWASHTRGPSRFGFVSGYRAANPEEFTERRPEPPESSRHIMR